MTKTACITGITGQTGSYLAELLLEKGYKVFGLLRRSSTFTTDRIDHIYGHPNLELRYGDMADTLSIVDLVTTAKPELFFNMAAMSHVRVSFDIPEYTFDIDATGTIRCLEAIRRYSPDTRFLQASTSELFGSSPPPQSELTPFHPRSPYAAAKCAAYWATVNYREAYDLFAVNAITFNHETVADFMPIIFKDGAQIDIKPISEVVVDHCDIGFDMSKDRYQEGKVSKELLIWDHGGWTKVKFASGYSHKYANMNKKPQFINARNSCFMATDTHVVIMEDGSEKKIEQICVGDKISNINSYPKVDPAESCEVSIEEARLLGFIVGDECVSEQRNLRLTAKNKNSLRVYADLWERMGGTWKFEPTISGFTKKPIWQLRLTGNPKWVAELDLYNTYGHKRVPKRILNASEQVQHAFLNGYNDADGLKNNPCTYKFKNFKTNSATLASGLLFLIENTTKQICNITIEAANKWGYRSYYYSINLLSDNCDVNNARMALDNYHKTKEMLQNNKSILSIHNDTGISYGFIHRVKNGHVPSGKHHFEKSKNEVKKVVDCSDFDGWFFDLETESGTFHCGIGRGHVHNSPRRHETFVTRKVTMAASRIKLGLQERLVLGNLEARRDWSHAKDVVRGMYLMLTADTPDDYVISTGVSNSIRYLCETVFSKLDLDYRDYVDFGAQYLRPSEVIHLEGDSSKIRAALGWKPEYTFDTLIAEMIEHDMKLAQRERLIKDSES